LHSSKGLNFLVCINVPMSLGTWTRMHRSFFHSWIDRWHLDLASWTSV
jgi:hypothetical protein